MKGTNMNTKSKSNRATFEVAEIDVDTPQGYVFATGFYVIGPNGMKSKEAMRRQDAINYCRSRGWDFSAIING